jgi:hypothetical protein
VITVESVPVGKLGGCGCRRYVVVQLHQFWEIMRDDLSQEYLIKKSLPPSAKSRVMFFLGLERGI